MDRLAVTVNGIVFPNPVLPAAGPNVRSGDLMVQAARGGAGGIVSKTVSVVPAADPRASIRRMSNRGLVNCETWSEIPVERYLEDLSAAKATGLPLVVSIGYAPEEVHQLGALIEREIQPHAFEFSTHYTGHDVEPIVAVARSLRESVETPVWMKLSPNFPDIPALARAAGQYVDAFVAINSFGPVLEIDPENPEPLLGSQDGTGWMSGPPLRPIALRIVRELARSSRKPVIGVGGVETGLDAIRFLMAGAVMVQVCSAAIRRGQETYGKIAGEVEEWLDAHGYGSVDEIVGLYQPEGRSPVGKGHASALMEIDPAFCTGCKACMGQCIHQALWMDGEVAAVRPDACIGCGYCQDSCRYGAMRLVTAGRERGYDG